MGNLLGSLQLLACMMSTVAPVLDMWLLFCAQDWAVPPPINAWHVHAVLWMLWQEVQSALNQSGSGSASIPLLLGLGCGWGSGVAVCAQYGSRCCDAMQLCWRSRV